DRQISGLLALENSPDVGRRLAKRITKARRITDKAASRHKLARIVDDGHQTAHGESNELIAMAEEERIGAEHKRISPLSHEGLKGIFEIAFRTGSHDVELESKRICCRLHFFRLHGGIRVVRIH